MSSRKHEKIPSIEYAHLRGVTLIEGKLSRTCPVCDVTLIYETVKGFEYSVKQRACCASCGTKKQPIVVPADLTRSCPSCSTSIVYKSAQSYRQAEKSDRKCRVCSDDSTRKTTRSEEWRMWRSNTYYKHCTEQGSAVRKAYDALQSARSMIGNVSKKEQALTLALKTSGFAAGKIKGWYCDAVNYDTKVVVELHGDWWHVKPGTRHERIIRENYDGIHPLSKISIEQIWERDAKKQCVLEALGYTYIVVWESDLDEWLSWIQDSLK